ncbi:MAG TPA: DUF4058 family protein [Planctomycetaceae bacterium]|nr:DUF4058 family protein [Planctomycetaceae bacterium]
MPSPFPGMDPYIESQEWEDFHTRFVTEIGNSLVPYLRPRYEARIERRIYVARTTGEPARVLIPDVAVVKQNGGRRTEGTGTDDTQGTGVATLTRPQVVVEPVRCRLPLTEEHREAFLTIRRAGTKEIVTVLEVLSPDNKRPGHKGRRKYLRKREAVLDSPASLVELDLLRGGTRLPMEDPIPVGDYYAFVSRGREPLANVYAWSLRHAVPPLPVPLAEGDRDVPLDLQAVFTTVYDRAGYDYSLDYHSPLTPPLPAEDAEWAAALLT